MSYTNFNQYNDARMGSRNGPPARAIPDQRYPSQNVGRSGAGYGYQQPYNTVSVAPMPQVPVALPNGAVMPVFPPHPDTKPRPQQHQAPPMMMHGYQQRMNIQELVLVPPELSAFASDPQFQQILLKVKEQTMINFISLNRTSNDSVESIAIDAPSRESAQLARGLIETHFKLQSKLKAAETRLQKVQTDLFSAQGEIASGMMIEFTIDPELVGLALGKKGARIKQIEAETKVTSINVTGETGRIMIVGPDNQSVQRARELLELQEECIPLESHQIDWLSNKYNSGMLNDIKAGSDLIVTRVNSEKFTLDIVGTVAAVRSARFMLPTQMEYVAKQIELEATERQAREKLQQVRKQYGLNRYDRDGGGGDRDDQRRSGGDRDNHRGDRDRNRNANGGNGNNSNGGNGNSRTNGQDSLVTLANTKKAASTPQDVAAAYAKASKKPVVNASTPGTKTEKASGRTVETQPVPMLNQVTSRNDKKQNNNNAGKNTDVAVDAITSGVKNLKVEPSSTPSSAQKGNRNNTGDNRNQQQKKQQPAATASATATAAPIVYQDNEQSPLPQRKNNRNNNNRKDKADAAPTTASTATTAAAAPSTPPPPGLVIVAPAAAEVAGGDKTQGSNRRRGGNKKPADAATGEGAAAAAAAAGDAAASAGGASRPKSGRGRGGGKAKGADAAATATESA